MACIGKKYGLVNYIYFCGREEYFVFNGKKEGEYKHYFRDGKLFQTYNYVDGQKEGVCESYYFDNDGTQSIHIHIYKNGKNFITKWKKN